MEHEEDSCLVKVLKDMCAHRREHAGYFYIGDSKEASEMLVLDYFLNALDQQQRMFVYKSKHRGERNDPPDCEAIDDKGARIGIEITELVDQMSAESADIFSKQGQNKSPGVHLLGRKERRYDWKDWEGSLIPEIQKIINKKDACLVKAKGGPYEGHILLMYSDEPWLELEYVEKCLASHEFDRPSLITRAFLVLSPKPSVSCDPCFELRFVSNAF